MDSELMMLVSLMFGVFLGFFMGIFFTAMYYLCKKDNGYLDKPAAEIKNVKIWSKLKQ